MNEAEIIKSYRLSRNKDKQIRVLAELNTYSYEVSAVHDAEYHIVMILKNNGVLEESATTKKILKRGLVEERRQAFRVFSGFIADCLSAIDTVNPREQAQYLAEIEGVREFLGGEV